MVEVFKTNIIKKKQANKIIMKLNEEFPNYKINFDLEDCDNVLRVESSMNQIDNKLIIKLINDNGFYIDVLPDTLNVNHSSIESFKNQI